MLTYNWVHNIRYYYSNIRAWNSCWSSDIIRSTLKLVLPIANTPDILSYTQKSVQLNDLWWSMWPSEICSPLNYLDHVTSLSTLLPCFVSSSMINNRIIQRKYAKYRKRWASTCIWKLSTHVLRYKHCITAAMIFIYSVQFVDC